MIDVLHNIRSPQFILILGQICLSGAIILMGIMSKNMNKQIFLLQEKNLELESRLRKIEIEKQNIYDNDHPTCSN